jgi:hypothetical protein
MTTFVLIPFNDTHATEAPSFTSDLTNATLSMVGSLWNNLTNATSSNYTPSYHEEESYGNYGKDEYGSSYGSDSYASAKGKYGDGYSYGKMSVAVLTLGLVIIVEALLKRIDAFAIGKPFGLAVLEAVYRECKRSIAAATLLHHKC